MDKLLELIYRVLSVVLVTTSIAEKVFAMVRELRRQRRDGDNRHE